MKPAELYLLTPERVSYFLPDLKGSRFNHVLEIAEDFYQMSSDPNRWCEDPNRRIEIRYYKYFDFDGRRCWRLGSVWFDAQPVMIIQNAGREGDDYHARFITDHPRYRQMILYLRQIVAPQDESLSDVVSVETEIPSLTEFYGNKLDGYFERYRPSRD